MIRFTKSVLFGVLILVLGAPVFAQQAPRISHADTMKVTGKFLAGATGSSSRWGSGWLKLATVADFSEGNLLRLRVGGSAKKIVVRLMPNGGDPDSSVGIIGGIFTVPESRVVEVVLETDRRGISQISVHGGPNPWGKFPLGGCRRTGRKLRECSLNHFWQVVWDKLPISPVGPISCANPSYSIHPGAIVRPPALSTASSKRYSPFSTSE